MGFFRKSKWTLESREGRDTPSFQELFYFMITPGSIYHTGKSDNPEMAEYLGISTLVKIGGLSLAADAILAAEAAGTTAIYSEFVMYRQLQAVMRTPYVLAGAGLLALNYAYTRDLARRDLKFKIKHASGMDPGSMTQPISPMHDFGGNPGGPSGAGY